MKNASKKTYAIKQLDEALAMQWDELWKRSENPTVFNSRQWFMACTETFNVRGCELHVCYDGDKLVAVLPLCPYSRFGIKALGSVCNHFLVDSAFLMERYDKQLIKYFFTQITSENNLFIQKIDNKAALLLHKIFPGMFFPIMSVNPCVLYLQDPFGLMSKSALEKIRIVLKKNPGLFKLKCYKDNELDKILETIFHIDLNSAKQKQSKDIFSRGENCTFFTNLIKNCLRAFLG